MKTEYLRELRALLDQYQMSDVEKQDIISDYSEMYDNWSDYGMADDDIEKKLGKPSSIYRELVEGYRKVGTKEPSPNMSKIVALTPFVATIVFFIIGFGFNGWAWGWIAYLLIPVTAIWMNMENDPHRLTALSPFIAVVAFFILGFVYGLWHPGWLVFIIIPIIAIFTERKSIGFLNTIVSLSPLVITATFVYIGIEENLWVPGWVLFLLIPAIAVLNEKRFFRAFLWELFILGGIAGYLYWGYTFEQWDWALLAFAPLVVYSVLQDTSGWKDVPAEYKYVSLGAIAAFVLLGIITGIWGYVWLVFLAIPVYAIYRETDGNARLISLMPFISTFIFFTLGWFLDLWAWSWIAFLLIPVVAIWKEA